MSDYFSRKWAVLEPYVPGEQPRDMRYVKLNTNESPFAPAQVIADEAASRMRALNLYPDPTYLELRTSLAATLSRQSACAIACNNVIVGNGSDELLNWAFAAWCDDGCPAVAPDITYGFYPVFAANNRVPFTEVPLNEDFSIPVEAFCAPGRKTVFLANPNAPTGKAVSLSAIEDILRANPDNVLVVDEAYVDFGAQSAVGLVENYSNLLVTQTFSKSRSMAGARLGFAVGNAALIADLETLRNSTNPYNVNNATQAWGLATLAHDDITLANSLYIQQVRASTTGRLRELGFEVIDSLANFVFMRHGAIDGGALYEALKQRGILVRHFTRPRIADYNRVTIGTREQMDEFLSACTAILEDCE